MTQAPATESATRRRRWFRFSLRSLLILMTLVAAGLGWVGKERMQSSREDQFAKEHPNWHFEWQPPNWHTEWQPQHLKWLEHWRHRLAKFVLGPRVIQISLYPSCDPKFNDLTPLVGLKNLQGLWLHSTQVTDLTPLVGLKNLKGLWLHSTQVTDLTPLAGLKNLQQLDITSNPVTDLTPLAGLKNLKYLNLESTPVTDLTTLAGLKNLQKLVLVKTPATDLTPLSGLTNLQWLDITANQVADEQVKWLQAKLPHCRITHITRPVTHITQPVSDSSGTGAVPPPPRAPGPG